MKKFTSPTQIIGEIGEDVACAYLRRRGYSIVERNFARKWGEIDIVAEYCGKLHFIEVKSVSREKSPRISAYILDETDEYRPEDQMHWHKTRRLIRMIETYLANKPDREWQFDVLCIYLDFETRRARAKFLEDIILSR